MKRLLLTLLITWLVPHGALAVRGADKPNIIHIMIDDAGLGDFTSFWADSPVRTPNLVDLARQGMRFTQAYCGAANCAPSRSALMTGRHLGHAYMRCNAGSIAIRDVDVTIAEVLKQAGYATGGYGKWGLGPPGSPGAPERQGFDEFVGYYDQVHAHSHYPDRIYDSGKPLLIPENANFNEPETGLVGDTRVHAHKLIYDRMRSFVQTNATSKTPFYAWGAWTPPHRKSTLNQPEANPGGLYEQYADNPGWDDFDKIQASYLTWIDRQVADLQQVLADPNGDGDTADSVLENTLILFTSDNGGWQSAHAWDRNIETRNGQTVDIRGAKEGYYEGGLRTPMIAYWPGTIPAGSETSLPVAFYDYMPTFAELAGAADRLPIGTDGVSFAPTLTGAGVQQQREGLYFEGYAYKPNQKPTQIARIGDWKMIRHRDGAVELFDLASDPSETTNRVDDAALRAEHDRLANFILRNHAPITAQLPVLPSKVGTGNANRDGMMSFGVRPASDSRNWRVVTAGDVRAFAGAVVDKNNAAVGVYLDDLHMVYTIELTLLRVAKPTPEVAVELVGASGFAYFRGTIKTDKLPIGGPQAVQATLDVVGDSPTAEQLTADLGSSLSVRLSHDGENGQALASRIVLSGTNAVLKVAPAFGDQAAQAHPADEGQIGAPISWIEGTDPPEERIMVQRTRDGKLLLTANEAFFPAEGLIATGTGSTPDVGNLNGGRAFAAIEGWRPGRVAEWGVYCGAAGKASVRLVLEGGDGQEQFALRIGTEETPLTAEPGGAESPRTLVGEVTFQQPGPQTVQLVCRRADEPMGVRQIELSGPATAGGGVMRHRWRPSAAHAKFSSSRVSKDIRLWIMELDAAPGARGFYCPVTTPFGYYGPTWRNDGSVGPGLNFSLWSFRRGQPEPATDQLSHLLAVGNPTAEFGGFDHEGTGVKVRNWEPLAGRQGQRQAIALRVEPGPRYDTYFSYFYAHDQQRWQFFAAGAKANGGRPLQSLWVGSFVEVPGPPTRQRTGIYPRTMRYRGWVCDAQGAWAPLDRMTFGDVDRKTGLTPTNRGALPYGRFWLSAGGWSFRPGPETRFVTLDEPVEVDASGYWDAAAQAYLTSVPVSVQWKACRREGSSLLGVYELHGATEPVKIEAFWGPEDQLSFADRWPHRRELSESGAGSTEFAITDAPSDEPICMRLLVTCREGKFWSPSVRVAEASDPSRR